MSNSALNPCYACGEHMLYLWTMMPVCVNKECERCVEVTA